MRQSFLPGFDDDVPFVLVDVELDEQADLRMIGRLLDGPDARRSRIGDRGVGVSPSRTSPPASSVPAFALVDDVSGRFAASTRSRSSATRRARCERHARQAARRDRGRHGQSARSPTRGSTSRRSTASPPERCSRPRVRTRSRTASASSASNWLAEHLGVNPRYVAGFQGYGQIPGSVALAVNAVASGAADYVLMHRALHNPAGQLPRQPDARGARRHAVDGAAGVLRPAGDDRVAVQRVPPALRRATREAMAAVRGRGAQERRAHPVVVLARQAADAPRSTSRRR